MINVLLCCVGKHDNNNIIVPNYWGDIYRVCKDYLARFILLIMQTFPGVVETVTDSRYCDIVIL